MTKSPPSMALASPGIHQVREESTTNMKFSIVCFILGCIALVESQASAGGSRILKTINTTKAELPPKRYQLPPAGSSKVFDLYDLCVAVTPIVPDPSVGLSVNNYTLGVQVCTKGDNERYGKEYTIEVEYGRVLEIDFSVKVFGQHRELVYWVDGHRTVELEVTGFEVLYNNGLFGISGVTEARMEGEPEITVSYMRDLGKDVNELGLLGLIRLLWS